MRCALKPSRGGSPAVARAANPRSKSARLRAARKLEELVRRGGVYADLYEQQQLSEEQGKH